MDVFTDGNGSFTVHGLVSGSYTLLIGPPSKPMSIADVTVTDRGVDLGRFQPFEGLPGDFPETRLAGLFPLLLLLAIATVLARRRYVSRRFQ